MSSSNGPTIGFLLGKPVKPDTVFPEVFARLEAMRFRLDVHVPRSGTCLTETVSGSSLVVQRRLAQDVMRAVRRIEVAGLRCCNPVASTRLAANRMWTMDRLGRNGIPTPVSVQLADWDAVCRSARGPVVIKAVDGLVGRGRQVFVAPDGDLPPNEPFAGPYVLQEHIESGDGMYKLYVAGPHVRCLIRPSEAHVLRQERGTPCEVDDDFKRLALLTGQALNLDIYGVDVLCGAHGPAVVDVNPFPGFRGVPDGARMIAEHLASLADSAQYFHASNT
jgi:ribosomal protein S6--L-glutamate ligase